MKLYDAFHIIAINPDDNIMHFTDLSSKNMIIYSLIYVSL